MKKTDFAYEPKTIEEWQIMKDAEIKDKKANSKLKTDNLVRLILGLVVCAILICLVAYAFTGREGLIEKALTVGGMFTASCFAYFAGKGAKDND